MTDSNDFDIQPGKPLPFGVTTTPEGVNFAIASKGAEACTLVLFERGAPEPMTQIAIPDSFKVGDVFAVTVLDLDPNAVEYGFRFEGPDDVFRRFDPDVIVLDPYAREIGGHDEWGNDSHRDDAYPYRARIAETEFNWEEDRPLERPIEDCIIYEMHVRAFTRDDSAEVDHPGTYAAIKENIPYLKELGVNCVELMPIADFDEFINAQQTESGEWMFNYWGYNPISFFAPKAGYAASDSAREELKDLIKALHENDIEVILDVVYNHTAEGNGEGPVISFKGIDNDVYYLLNEDGEYYNFTGVGNTFNANHPRARHLILESLRHWVLEYHVDGFRFDIAAALTRDLGGAPMDQPPLPREIAEDPILECTKLIAEPWDADMLYHLGSFPGFGEWAEWNAKYRDTIRRFLRGDEGQVEKLASAMLGSPDLYGGRGPIASVNFITAHDGFTLMDLVSYEEKHNDPPCAEDGGVDENYSRNYGEEGPTDDEATQAVRRRQIKNAVGLLMMSQGTPMLLMGDEIGRTQEGHNNGFCLDNPQGWINWELREENGDLFAFFKACIAFRMAHPVLRGGHFIKDGAPAGQKSDDPDIFWHGVKPGEPDWSEESRELAFTLRGDRAKGGLAKDQDIYMAMNMSEEEHTFEVPEPPNGGEWYIFVNTSADEVHEPGSEPPLEDDSARLMAHSIIILVAK